MTRVNFTRHAKHCQPFSAPATSRCFLQDTQVTVVDCQGRRPLVLSACYNHLPCAVHLLEVRTWGETRCVVWKKKGCWEVGLKGVSHPRNCRKIHGKSMDPVEFSGFPHPRTMTDFPCTFLGMPDASNPQAGADAREALEECQRRLGSSSAGNSSSSCGRFSSDFTVDVHMTWTYCYWTTIFEPRDMWKMG